MDFDVKLKDIKKVTSNKKKKTCHSFKKLNDLSKEVKLLSTKDYNFSLG